MRVQRIVTIAVLVACYFPPRLLSDPTPGVAASAPQREVRPPQGFLDYTLGKINPTNQDYGAELRSVRETVVVHSIDDLFFWSNAFTLVLLSVAVVLLLMQQRAADKKELIAATLITELWNRQVSDEIEIVKRTQQYNELVDLHNAEVERGLLARSNGKVSEENADIKVQRTVNRLAERRPKDTNPEKTPGVNQPEHHESSPSDDDKGRADLQQKILLQQGQLEALRNTEQNLKERLNQTTSLLEQERKRNQTLKGV